MGNWRPLQADRVMRPSVGAVVAFDRRAWSVTHIADAILTPEEQEWVDGYLPAYRAERTPYRISLKRLHGAPHDQENSRNEIALRVKRPESYPSPLSEYPDGRVPLCSCHGHPWPCIEADQHKAAKSEMEETARELDRLPGCCPGCHEPITQRQRSITFVGEYVRNPLADPDPTFHLRSKCSWSAAAYENAWVAADSSRKRSLLTLSCEGSAIVHEDGSGECFGAEDSDCPSIYAHHRFYRACYLQDHGCARCSSRRHGTSLAGRPTDPRDIPAWTNAAT